MPWQCLPLYWQRRLQWTREWKGGVGRLNSRDSLFDTLRSENIQSAMDSIPRDGTWTTLPSIPRDRPTSESGSAHDGATSPSLGGRLAARYANAEFGEFVAHPVADPVADPGADHARVPRQGGAPCSLSVPPVRCNAF